MEHQRLERFQPAAALGLTPEFGALAEVLPMALAFLNLGGAYVYKNARFSKLVGEQECLLPAPHILFSQREANRQLSAFLAECRSAFDQARDTRLFLDDGRRTPISVTMRFEPGAKLILATPVLVRPIRPCARTHAVLNKTYGLTPAEAECACLLSEGLSREAIAARRQVSFETIRCQLRSVRRKLNVRSANEIIARVLSFGEVHAPV